MQLYRVNFGKPITTTLIFKLNFLDDTDLKKAPTFIWNLTKVAVERGELETFWKRTTALNPANLAKLLYCEDVVKRLRGELKEQTGIYFQVEDVAKSLEQIIAEKIEFPRPKLRVKKKKLIASSEPVIEKIEKTNGSVK